MPSRRVAEETENALSADKTHRPRRRNETRIVNVVPRLFFHHDRFDEVDDFWSRGPIADNIAERMLHRREKAGADLTIGSQANARTSAAKWFCDWGDDADFSRGAVSKEIA